VTKCLTAAVPWPCKGSIIICPIIEGSYERQDESFPVSKVFKKLCFKWRHLNKNKGQEDPIELYFNKSPRLISTLTFFYYSLVGATKEHLASFQLKANRPIIWPILLTNEPSYLRDNSVIFFKSSHQQEGLRPRCWTRVSQRCSSF